MCTLVEMGPTLFVVSLSVVALSWYIKYVICAGNDAAFLDCNAYYYTFNKRFNVLEPPVRLQEKRFDIDRMMIDIPRVTSRPKDFDNYTVGGVTTGIHLTWNSDEVGLGDMCGFLISVAQYYLREATPADDKTRCLNIMGDWLDRYNAALPNPLPNQRFPWDKNWYQFSISSTDFLFHYMLCVRDVNKERLADAIDLTLRLIVTPRWSLGWQRKDANTIYMGLPWIVAHYLKGEVEEFSQHEDYLYVVDYIKFPIVTKRKDDGMYVDYTYITHTNVLAYGYLAEMTRMSKPIVLFDNMMRDFLLDWKRGQRILSHPTIPYGPIGFYSRDDRLEARTNADSPLSIRVIPTCLFIRMYHDTYSFAMRGQNDWIAYYESDKT